jgi:hypothetical protein
MERKPVRALGGLLLACAVLSTMPGCIVIPIATSGGTGRGAPAGATATIAAGPSRAEIVAAVKALVRKNSADVVVASVENIKTVKDAKGVWWAGATAVPADTNHLDQVAVYIYRDTGGWRLFDLGTGLEATDLPPDVRSIAQ